MRYLFIKYKLMKEKLFKIRKFDFKKWANEKYWVISRSSITPNVMTHIFTIIFTVCLSISYFIIKQDAFDIIVETNFSVIPLDFHIQYPISWVIVDEKTDFDRAEEAYFAYLEWGQYFDQYLDTSKKVIALPFKDYAEGYYLQGVDKWVEKKIAAIKKKDAEKKKEKERKEQKAFERSMSILYISIIRSLHVLVLVVRTFF